MIEITCASAKMHSGEPLFNSVLVTGIVQCLEAGEGISRLHYLNLVNLCIDVKIGEHNLSTVWRWQMAVL